MMPFAWDAIIHDDVKGRKAVTGDEYKVVVIDGVDFADLARGKVFEGRSMASWAESMALIAPQFAR